MRRCAGPSASRANFAACIRGSVVSIVNWSNGALMHTLEPMPDTIRCLAFAPNANFLYVSSRSAQFARKFDVKTGERVLKFQIEGVNDPISHLALTPNGKILILAYADDCLGDIIALDAQSGALLSRFSEPVVRMKCMIASPTFLFAGFGDGRILKFDVFSGMLLETFSEHTSAIVSLSLSSDFGSLFRFLVKRK